MREQCVHMQLGMAFLCHPPAALNNLLDSWGQYMTSPEHTQEVRRSCRVEPADEESVLARSQQLELKIHVHKLRHKLRQMECLERKQNRVNMTFSQKVDFEKYKSGALIDELDALTRQHGFGKLHRDGTMLRGAQGGCETESQTAVTPPLKTCLKA